MTILRGVPRVISPNLLRTLARMGHGDEIVLADANFPAASVAARTCGGLVDCNIPIPQLLDAILRLFPLDNVGVPIAVMDPMAADKALTTGDPPIWATYHEIVSQRAGTAVDFERIERYAFYERAKGAFAVVGSTEGAMYGNLILRKGVLPSEADPQAGAIFPGSFGNGDVHTHSNMTR